MSTVVAPTPAIQGHSNARVYNLNEGDIAVRPSTSVSSQLSVSNLPLYTLLDLGAIYLCDVCRFDDNLDSNK